MEKAVELKKLEEMEERICQKIQKVKAELEDEILEEEIDEDIEETDDSEDESDDVVIAPSKISKKGWKKVATVAGVAAVAGAGVILAVRRPWEATKVVSHIVHIV